MQATSQILSLSLSLNQHSHPEGPKITSPTSTKGPNSSDEQAFTLSAPTHSAASSTAPTIPKRSLQDVDHDIRTMDTLYNCNFGAWCKSQAHIADTAKYLQRFIGQYSEQAVATGLSWIVAGWGLRSSAELLLRAFAPWGVGHPMVARTIGLIMSQFSNAHAKLELVAAVIAFESAHNAAGFFRHLTASSGCSEGWHEDSIALYFEYVVRKLGWKPAYCEAFILQFCEISQKDLGVGAEGQIEALRSVLREERKGRGLKCESAGEGVKFYVKMMHRLAFETQKGREVQEGLLRVCKRE